jgi:GDP-L-fucose synthase
MDSDSKIMVAGAKGMVGSAIVRNLKKKGYYVNEATRDRVDFTDQEDTEFYFSRNKPEYVFVAAAKVGGIMANKLCKADFLYQNLMIQNNIIHCAYKWNVKKLLFLGSSCIYPRWPEHMPIIEDDLLGGPLEPTNDAYAIAKIAGIKMCQAYREQYGFNAISLMPTNLYGPNDNFDLQSSHVLPALIRKFHEAKESNAPYVECWGDGSPMREFLHVDDLAEACFRCMISYNDSEIINVGTGEDISIRELTRLISIIVGYGGLTMWDDSKPNGTPRKVLNVDKIKSLGWSPKIGLRQGIYETYEWYKNEQTSNL